MARQDTAISDMQRKLFEEKAIPHMDAVYKAAFRLTGNADDANDLAQDVYLKAYRFFKRFKQGTHIKNWLFRILKNTYINDYRKRLQGPSVITLERVEDLDELPEVLMPETPEDRIFAGPDDEIMNAIEELPEYYRVVVVLCDLEGLSYKEIAAIIGRPRGTVMSRLYRAREILEKSLWDYARDHGYVKQKKRRSKKRV